MTNPAWVKGVSGNPKGKPKGAVNKVTQDLRLMVHEALEKAGGVNYLWTQARENPQAFLALVRACLPRDVRVSGDIGLGDVVRQLLDKRAEMQAQLIAGPVVDVPCKVVSSNTGIGGGDDHGESNEGDEAQGSQGEA